MNKYLLALCLSVSSIPLFAIKPNQHIQHLSAVSPVDEIIDAGRKQLNQIGNILAGLSGIITDNQVSITYKKETLTHLHDLNSLISMMNNEKFALVDLETAYSLLKFNEILIKHTMYIIGDNFQNAQKYNAQTLIQRMKPVDTVEPIQVIDALNHNELALEKALKMADNCGLHWYHHAARTVDNYILTPCHTYAIPRRVGLAVLCTFGGLYTWWNIHPESFKNKTPDAIKRFFVPKDGIIRIEPDPGNPFADPSKFGDIDKADSILGQVMRNVKPIGMLTFGATAKGLSYEYELAKPKIIKLWRIVTNKLKGGSYLREAKRIAEKVENVRFSDLCGQEEIVREFRKIVDYLANPESFDRLGLTPPKGILCIGDTRTGKTFAVTALFGEIQAMLKAQGKSDSFKFIPLQAYDVNTMGIKPLLDRIQNAAPCVVFIDEIDLFDLTRAGKNEILSEFLTCMSGALSNKEPSKQVIIVAATNRPETMDQALRTDGRFGKELRFEYPNKQDRTTYITHKLEKLSLDLTQFNIERIVLNTENKSYETLAKLINNALFKARTQGEMLTQKHILETLNEDLRHIIPTSARSIPAHEVEILAAHFAGQAVALLNMDCPTKLSGVTIKQVMTDIKEEMMGMHLWGGQKEKQEQQRFEYGKLFTCHNSDTINMSTKDEKMKLIQLYLAGFVAEEFLLGSCGYSCHPEDKQTAMKLAQSIAFQGLNIEKLPKAIQNKYHEEALQIMEQCKETIQTRLRELESQIRIVADALKKAGTLSVEEIKQLFAKK